MDAYDQTAGMEPKKACGGNFFRFVGPVNYLPPRIGGDADG